MFTAIAGVIVSLAFRPAEVSRTPRSTPIQGLQLYSTAGARLQASLEPELRITGAPCASNPVTRVLALLRYVMSVASTQLRVRLYSQELSK